MVRYTLKKRKIRSICYKYWQYVNRERYYCYYSLLYLLGIKPSETICLNNHSLPGANAVCSIKRHSGEMYNTCIFLTLSFTTPLSHKNTARFMYFHFTQCIVTLRLLQVTLRPCS